MGTQETIMIYRLNCWCENNAMAHIISNFGFWGPFGRGMGVAGTPAPWGLKPEQKVGPRWVLLGYLLSQNRVPKLSDPGPSPPYPSEFFLSLPRPHFNSFSNPKLYQCVFDL